MPPSFVPSWTFLDVFTARNLPREEVPTWTAVDDLRALVKHAAGAQHLELDKLLLEWDQALADIGGDPAYRDWSEFRPLRLSREEDWSDWLAHLIAASTRGFLARELLGDSSACAKDVKREVQTNEGFRADLVVEWDAGRYSHIEVKVGDTSFDKTFGTATALRAGIEHAQRWTDHILIPEDHREAWPSISKRNPGAVATLTWTDVAVALRTALRAKGETVDWRVWAAAFLGSVEQTLLRIPARVRSGRGTTNLAQLLPAAEHLEILRKAQP